MKFPIVTLTAALLLSAVSGSFAGTLGLTPSPLGSHPSATSFVFDTFTNTADYPDLTITNQASTTTSGSLFTSTLSASMQGMVTGSGQRIYNGIGPDSGAFNISLTGTAQGGVNLVTLQIRFTQPDGYNFGNFFTATLNGVAGTSAVTVSDQSIGSNGTGSNERYYGVVRFTWNGLDLDNGDALNLAITSPAAGHASIDAIQVDAVPEPSTYALLTAAGAGLMALKRRRARA